MTTITKEWLSSDAIDSQVLTNNTFSKGRNNANSADINMFKVNTSDKIEAGADLQMGSFNLLTSGLVDGYDVGNVGGNVGNLVTLSGVAADSTHLGTFTGSTIADSRTVKQALQDLETYGESTRSLVQAFEWYQSSALDYITDNTATPPTEVSGDVYVLSATGGVPHANYDGASAGDIVKFNGSVWVATTPTTGMMISVDDETTSLRQWSGSAWVQKSFESTTASTGLTKVGVDIRLADAAAFNGVIVSSGAISLNPDNSTVELNSNALRVKANGIGENEINNVDGAVDADSFVLSSAYSSGAGTVAAGDTIETAIEKIVGNIAAATSADAEFEVFTLGAGDITNQYVDFAQVAMADSVLVWPVGGPPQIITVDYTLSYTGGAGGKTRLTFAGDLASKLVAGKKLAVKYLRA